MSEVFLCRKGSLTPASKRALKEAGVVVVEATNPSDCKFIRATETVSSGDMLFAAMQAMSRAYDHDSYGIAQRIRSNFAMQLAELVKAAHDKENPS